MKKSLIASILVLVVVVVAAYILVTRNTVVEEIPNTPEIPSVPDPKTEAEKALDAKKDFIQVSNLKPYDTVSLPLTITGQARLWYFEGSFPVTIKDKNGTVILSTYASAQGDWMTTEFVPFSVTISSLSGYTGPATLVLQKDNPSGEQSLDDSVEIPIFIESL